MENNNPAEMSNEDLEKDMEQYNAEAKQNGNQEHVNKSSATEGSLLTPETDPHTIDKIRNSTGLLDDEKDMDDLVHSAADDDEDSQDGSMPDPEELDNWERRDDPNKISS